MKKLVSLFLVSIMVLSMAGCGKTSASQSNNNQSASNNNNQQPVQSDSEEQPVTLMWASGIAPKLQCTLQMEYTKEYLEQIGSSISLNLQYSGVMGSEREIGEQIMLGTIEMGSVSDLALTPLMPKLSFVNFPGVFRDYDDVKENYWNGWVKEEINEICEDNNLKLLGFADNDFRWITNSIKPVTTLKDLSGMKLRVPEVDYLVEFFSKLNVLSTPIAFGELSSALQQGVVDGQENGPFTLHMYGLYEFNKYATITNHSYSSHLVIVNEDVFNALSPKQQQELTEAVAYACEKQQEYVVNEMRPQIIADLESEEFGVELEPMNEELYNELVEIGEKMASSDKWLNLFGQEIVDKMYP